jgi:N-methylhydantoinase A
LGGRIKLDRDAAEKAVGGIAGRLGIALVDAAYAIHTASNHNMITAIEDITVREGINPRDSYLVCGGGATACHIGEMAAVLGIDRVMVPKYSAGLSALGGLISDIRFEESATWHTAAPRFDVDGVNRILERLCERGRAFLERAGVPEPDRRFEYVYLGRYEYQSWEIEVPFEPTEGSVTAERVPRLVQAFHDMHERIYTIKDEDDTVEFTTWKVRAVGQNRARDRRVGMTIDHQDGKPMPKAHRPVYIHDQGGMSDTPIYDGNALGQGAQIDGPAVIEEETFTTLLLNGQSALVDARGNYLITVAPT